MAGIRRTEQLIGTVDGVNKVFVTLGADPYLAGSTVAFVAGLPRWSSNDDGYYETDPAAGEITFKEAPLPGDDPALSWIPQSEASGESIERVLVFVTSPPEVVLEVTEPAVAIVVDPLDAVVEVANDEIAVTAATSEVIVYRYRI